MQPASVAQPIAPEVRDLAERIQVCPDAAIRFTVLPRPTRGLDHAFEQTSLVRCEVATGAGQEATKLLLRSTILLSSSPSLAMGGFTNSASFASATVESGPLLHRKLSQADEYAIEAAVSARMLEITTKGQAVLRSDLIHFGLALNEGKITPRFANEWEVLGRELAPRPTFALEYKGERFVLSLRAPRLWFPTARLDGSVTVSGITINDSATGPAIRRLYEAIRTQHDQTKPHLHERFVERAS